MQDNKKKTEEIFHLKNRKPIIIVIEKNNHAITSNIQDYFCTFVLDSKSRKQFKFFFSPKLPPNLFLNSLFLPASFLVSNENQAKNQISKQTKPSK
jgi:hypothetical protein